LTTAALGAAAFKAAVLDAAAFGAAAFGFAAFALPAAGAFFLSAIGVILASMLQCNISEWRGYFKNFLCTAT
jgi:hypothetical protein